MKSDDGGAERRVPVPGNSHDVLGQSATPAVKPYRVYQPRLDAAQLLGYVPPELHETRSGWYLDYYARHPQTGLMKRVRIKLMRVKNRNARRAWARHLIQELTIKLQSGWTPWKHVGHAVMTMGEALEQWDSVKGRQLRHSSPYSYSSMTAIIREWMRANGWLERTVHEFRRPQVARFFTYLVEERQVSNRTFNNYLVFMTMMCNWMVQQSIITTSPVIEFKKLKTASKSRTYLTPEERTEMVSWIRQNDPDFLWPCLFIYGTLIRPGELRRLKVHHLDLDRQVVSLPAEETKSGAERTPAIPDWMRDMLVEAGFKHYPGRCFLISTAILPGEKRIARNTLNRHWVKMRTSLGWDNRRQLYSLRDTGIIQLLRDGVDLLHVMQQAGHTEVATTNKYLRHAFPKGPAEVKSKSTPLIAASPISAT